MSRKFQRRIEDFTCGHCGARVTGDGYTNHCPQCLWSLHVDINPGDRAHECGGLMQPVDITGKNGGYVITHQCTKCGHQQPNRTHIGDKTEAILDLMRDIANTRVR